MSRVNQVVCDHCGKVQKDTWDNAMPEWRIPDRWDGWWSVDTTGMDSREHYDLCCLKCLKEWVKGKADYWDRIEKDGMTLTVLEEEE